MTKIKSKKVGNVEDLTKDSLDLMGFLIDMDGDDVICEDTEVVNSYGSVPRYDSGYSGILATKEFSMETGTEIKDARPKKTCFNCLGDHSISDCPEERDLKQININKKNILGKRSSARSAVRYHEDFENCSKDIRPGQISQDLRNALGLYDDEAPLFFYRMRYLGYPPGWLKHAEVQRASVSLFDGDGVELAHPDFEEGETESAFTKYEPDKLVEFPGFNVDFPKEIKDQTCEHNMPRMSHHQCKEKFKKYMMLNKATKYKKKKLKTSDTPISADQLADQSYSSSSNDKFNLTIDDSVIEIDLKGDPILTSQDENNCPAQNNSGIIEGTCHNSTIELDTTQSQSSESLDYSRLDSDQQEPRLFLSKSVNLGIHIPPSITVHKTLPSFDKWMVDISDHIDFENLPEALGMWSKMKGVVSNVKRLMDNIQVEQEKESDSD